MKIIQLAILLLSALVLSGCTEYIYKSPQGDPSEFSMFTPPTPEETAQHSTAAFLEIELQLINGQYVWKGEVACDSQDKLSFSFLSPVYEHLKIQILPPGKKLVTLEELAREIKGNFGVDGASYEAHTFEITKPTKGIWQVLVTSSAKAEIEGLRTKQLRSGVAQGMLIVGNDSPYQAVAHMDTLKTLNGKTVGYELRLAKMNPDSTFGEPIIAHLEAELDIVEPDGEEMHIQMHDDGLEGDRAANDGIFYGSVKVTEDGLYQASMKLSGSDPEGAPLLRTVESVFQVVTDSLDLKGGAYAVLDKDHQVFDIYLRVNAASAQLTEGSTYKVWSEVWGKDAQGNFVPVAWVSGIKTISKDSNGQYVLGSLELNQRWVDKVSVVSDLQLRNLRVSDLDWSVILETSQIIAVEMEEQELPHIALSQADEPLDVLTLSMTQGWKTKAYVDASPVLDAAACTLTLVHGYCAGSNPFPTTNFTNPTVFTGGLKQSLSNDAFSKRLISFIEYHACTTAIGHSQGGMAITHSYNFYVTPFDRAPNHVRLLQTVGTPFQGTALAGSIASLGEIFGAGCGSNNDLTYNGAKSWMSGVSNRSRVFYYFTQYGKSGLIHYCNLAANLVLAWPNDGTTENAYAPLPGANNQPGNPTIGECHIEGMADPPQCHSASRNSLMNSYAYN